MFFFFLLRPGFGGTGAGWMRRRASSALTDGLVFPTPDGGFSFSFFFSVVRRRFLRVRHHLTAQGYIGNTRLHEAFHMKKDPPPKKRSWQQQHDKCWKNSKMTHPIVRISSPITQVVSGRLLAASDWLHRIKTLQVSVMIRCVQKSLL